MNIIEAIILGILQGITEFLPISSSGHLVLFSKLFNINQGFIFFSVVLHFATLLAVLIYYRKHVISLIKNPFSPLMLKLILATIPAIVVALLFSEQLEQMFDGSLLPFCFVFTGVLLMISQLFYTSEKKIKPLDAKGSVFMGLMQAVALVPGISRSGSTISAGLIGGYSKKESADFSFLMSVPIILASLCYELFKMAKTGAVTVFVFETIVGSVFAFATGLCAIYLMLKAVKKLKLHYFSYYLFALAIVSFFVV